MGPASTAAHEHKPGRERAHDDERPDHREKERSAVAEDDDVAQAEASRAASVTSLHVS